MGLSPQLVGRPARLHTLDPGQAGLDEPPDPSEEAMLALHLLVGPVHVLLRRRGEEDEQLRRVGAELLDDLPGRDYVALALRHLLAVAPLDDPLGDELLRRLVDPDQAELLQHLGPEAQVEQVQHGVLGPADVHVHRQPAIRVCARERLLRVVRVEIARPVPRRIDERVHRLGLPARRAATDGTFGVHPRGHLRQRRLPHAGEHLLDVDVR